MARLIPALLLAACVDPGLPDEASYDLDIEPLYAQRCVRCHEEDGWAAGAVVLDSYLTARSTRVMSACTAVHPTLADEHPELLTSVASPDGTPCHAWPMFSMPPDASIRLLPSEQRLLLRWIELGAPE